MSKYPLIYYRWLLRVVKSYLDDRSDIAEDLINFAPKADREALKDLFNLY